MSATVTVRRVEIPDADDEAFLADVAASVRLANLVTSADTGHDDLSTGTLAESVGALRSREDRLNDLFLAERDGRIVAAATTSMLARDAEAMETDLMLDRSLPYDVEVAEALLAAVDAWMRGHGLDVLQTWTLHRPDPPALPISPSTGVGVIDGATDDARFLAAQGFTLEQVERNSRFDLRAPTDVVERLLAEALAAAGPEYRVVHYVDHCPDDLLDSYAATVSRMSTDVPAGGTVIEADPLDGPRIRRREERMAAQGLTSLTTLAVHVPTGEVAAYNELVLGEDRSEPTHQYGTLVVREHRGRRLGMLVKAAGLLCLGDVAPDSPCVATFNAEENAHMLAINVELGFVPASYAGAWKRVPSPSAPTAGASGSADRSGSSGS